MAVKGLTKAISGVIIMFALLVLLTILTSLTPSPQFPNLRELASYLRSAPSQKVVREIGHGHFKFVCNEAPRACGEVYSDVQRLIASHVTRESSRPTIDLVIPGEHSKGDTVGLIGGIGPLSDAHILQRSLAGRHSLEQGIHLLSAPPPRSLGEMFTSGITYLYRLISFLRNNYTKFFLLSNTAHLNLNILTVFGAAGRIYHLPDRVTQTIQADAGRVLILGTQQAVSRRLYQDLFDALNISYVLPEDQDLVQAWIDQVKSSGAAKGLRTSASQQIYTIASQLEADIILLGCTELSLLVDKSFFPSTQIRIVDSEDILVAAIRKLIYSSKDGSP